MASVYDLACLSNRVYYENQSEISLDKANKKVRQYWGDNWISRAIKPKTNYNGSHDRGFYAAAYDYGEDTVMSIRGTDIKPSLDMNDVKSDAMIFLGWVPEQFSIAENFLQEVKKDTKGRTLYLTGHSLGGGLASLLATKYGLPVVTFNAPGVHRSFVDSIIPSISPFAKIIADHSVKPKVDPSRMLHIRAVYDVVSRGTGPHLGRVITIYIPKSKPITMSSLSLPSKVAASVRSITSTATSQLMNAAADSPRKAKAAWRNIFREHDMINILDAISSPPKTEFKVDPFYGEINIGIGPILDKA